VNADGTLTYTFVEGVKATYPYYVIRVCGGALYLSGMIMMAVNTWKTLRDPQPVNNTISGLVHA
jgi:cytochrome c oxidase cbb3-type subunit 1